MRTVRRMFFSSSTMKTVEGIVLRETKVRDLVAGRDLQCITRVGAQRQRRRVAVLPRGRQGFGAARPSAPP